MLPFLSVSPLCKGFKVKLDLVKSNYSFPLDQRVIERKVGLIPKLLPLFSTKVEGNFWKVGIGAIVGLKFDKFLWWRT
jgi:hypothetical protein